MMAAAAVTITEEREEIVDLSDQYYNSRRSLTVNTAETRDITATDQLGQGDVVAVHQPAIETNAGPCSSTRILIRPPDGAQSEGAERDPLAGGDHRPEGPPIRRIMLAVLEMLAG